jgi:SAM-dependent methyltransferase
MHASEYGVMRECEDAHWWYVALHELGIDTTRICLTGKVDAKLLDAGCGTGGFLEKVLETAPEMIGMEPSGFAFDELKSRKLERLVRGDLLRSPFASDSFDIVSSHDVIGLFAGETLEMAVHELCRMVRPDGYLILNLPAWQALLSDHDRFVGNKTRFTANQARKLLEAEGMKIEWHTYRMFLLFPAAVASRLIDRLKQRQEVTESDVIMPGPMINTILKSIMRLENAMIRIGIRLPWGLSLFIVARKNA